MAKKIARKFKFFRHDKDKSRNTTPTDSRVPTPTPDASPPLQVQADTSIAAGNKPKSISRPRSPKHQGIGSTIVDTLDTVLKVLKEASAPFPPLQAAVGGVCECISLYKNVSGNTEQLKSLANDLISRTTFLRPYLDPEGFGAQNGVVQDLINDLNNISQEVKEQQNTRLFQKIVQSEQFAEMIQEFAERIQGAYEQCKMKILFAVDRNTAEILKVVTFLGSCVALAQGKKSLNPLRNGQLLPTSDNMLGYWMSGMAGTGKSTIAMSICKALEEKQLLAGTFFCSRQIPECNDYRLIIPTLAYQLARFSRTFAKFLGKVLDENPDLPSKKPDILIKELLIEPWKAVTKSGKMGAHMPVIVIDALDECENVLSALKPLISAIQKRQMPGLKFFLTSRPEIQQTNSQIQEFILHNVEDSLVQKDIYTYLESELKDIYSSKGQLQQLTLLSGKLFIYAATVVKSVKGEESTKRQQETLTASLKGHKNHEDMAHLYAGIMRKAIPTKKRDPKYIKEDWMIIGTVISAGKPLTCKAIAELLETEEEVVRKLIHRLQAVCFISEQNKLMEQLRFNICDLPSSFLPDKEVPQFEERVQKNIGETLEYCCQFWHYHFIKCEMQEKIMKRLHEFLKEKEYIGLKSMSVLDLLPQCGEATDMLLKKITDADPKFGVIRIMKYLRKSY
ncbi:hypothetical protein BT96DRAFT_981789 [Gymnopus androsaceus JB14]|uniref:Nephrocystin 3-like N-terminal domain-containing protein n=1 Tax=Gymnopus androsaceus JB14 TaxID=1447944 RepID=A0A6A4GLU5_9AGAR|nr:hypothetical protein BT96DRAFT_981789 [Gymnopus androsaceus JB14]